jgi:predicted anti-sigma-YlaC factor YlaD
MTAHLVHPSHDRLLDHHCGKLDEAARHSVDGHVRACPACRDTLDTLVFIHRELACWGAPTPPADGLERVMARIEDRHPVASRLEWLAPATATLLAVVLGSLVISLAGPELAHHTPLATLPLTGALRSMAGQALAAAALFGIGSLVALALAPALLLEVRRRGMETPAR